MFGSQIYKVLKTNPITCKVFKGVYSSNNLPKLSNVAYPVAYIVNTDENFKPGEHWVAFYFKSSKAIPEYFDSFGLPPFKKSFLDFIQQRNRKYRYSSKTIQNLFSSKCGQYTIYYVFQKCCGKTLKEIIHNFSNDTIRNDNIVKDFVRGLKKKIRKKKVKMNIGKNQCSKRMASTMK